MAVGSFSAGLSGLSAHATALNVIGNNLANMNTVGFKASTVNFMDLVSQRMGGVSGITQIGLGVTTGSISATFTQGAIENSGEATNVAIQGNGLFVVKGENGIAYTRAGNFIFNAHGEMVTPDGYKVQGYTQIDTATGKVITTGEPNDIIVPRSAEGRAGIRRHLVLPATARAAQTRQTIDRFRPTRPDRIVLTRLDETETIPPLVSVLGDYELPVSYLTHGQNVPDDLVRATPAVLTDWLLGDAIVGASA